MSRRLFRLLPTVALLFIVATAGVGCSTLAPAPDDVDLTALAGEDLADTPRYSHAYHVGIADMGLDNGFAARVDGNGQGGVDRYVVDLEQMGGPLAQMSASIRGACASPNPHQGLGVFDEVGDLGATTISNDPTQWDATAEVFQNAWRAGQDLVVTMNVSRNDVSYDDTTGMYWPTVVMWLVLSPIPTWWWADEKFKAEMEVSISVYSAYRSLVQGRPYLITSETVTAEYTAEVDDFDQGWTLFSPFTTPGSLDKEVWESLGDVMLPHVRIDLQRQIIATLNRLGETSATAITEANQKTLALVFGAHPADGGEPLYTLDDAQDMAEYLEREATDLHLANDFTLYEYIGDTATSTNLIRAFSEDGVVGRNARPGDTVIVYYSGAGVVLDGEPHLLFNAADNRDGALSEQYILAAEDLRQVLQACPANVIVLLDCAFGGDYLSLRCGAELFDKDSTMAVGGTTPHFGEILARAPNVQVLAATQADEGALEIAGTDRAGNGLFTSRLLDILRNPGNYGIAADGPMSLEQIAEPLSRAVFTLSRRDSGPDNAQRPAIFGNGQDLPIFPVPDSESVPTPPSETGS